MPSAERNTSSIEPADDFARASANAPGRRNDDRLARHGGGTLAEPSPESGPAAQRDIETWGDALDRLLAAYDGSMAVRLPDGSSRNFGRAVRLGQRPSFTLCLNSPTGLRRLLLGGDPLRFAEAYFRGEIDVDGNLFDALTLKDHLQSLRLPLVDRLALLLQLLGTRTRGLNSPGDGVSPPRAGSVKDHSRSENRQAIAFHYDLSNPFYALWLDQAMVYSCAYFESPDEGLDQAQQAKLEHVCRKLRLAPGERFLDIGCGWGALIIHAARHHGVKAHGLTLSQRQLELARERIAAAGLQDRVSIELCDYRDMPAHMRFDKIASIGMFEHVGLKNLPTYFQTARRLLEPHGVFLNHGITHPREGWGDALSSRFINRYVFPDGELDTVSNIQRGMEGAGFEIVDVESLRPHYAMTLRHWVRRLEQHHEQALQFVNEATYRVWRLYMAACAMEFEAGLIGVYQIMATHRGAADAGLPLTRRYMYR